MFKALGGFDESMWTGEEWEFHLRCVSRGYKLHYEPKIVVNYRVWDGAKSVIYRRTRREERLAYFEEIRDRFREPSNT